MMFPFKSKQPEPEVSGPSDVELVRAKLMACDAPFETDVPSALPYSGPGFLAHQKSQEGKAACSETP